MPVLGPALAKICSAGILYGILEFSILRENNKKCWSLTLHLEAYAGFAMHS